MYMCRLVRLIIPDTRKATQDACGNGRFQPASFLANMDVLTFGVQILYSIRRGDFGVLECENGFDHGRQAARGLRMTNIGLDLHWN